ncbi:MAG: hypothetical protein M3256_08385 [Actinomycetota bacterium]|nr:hypothetical protein [Actinomycetota bacterium]
MLVTDRTMRWRLLAHPYLTGAVVALAVNDHILKGRVHGALTGKLSDFAGVFVIAVVLAALTGRPRFACSVSGLGFAAIKTVPLATAVAAPFLGGTTLRDPTDLVGLVMLYPAYRFASRDLRSQAEHSIPKQLLTRSSAVVAALAMSATSCARAPTVDAFVTVGGTVFARVYDETHDGAGEAVPAPRWASSQDGGATWVGAAEVPSSPGSSAREACSADLGCFRLGDERVEHSPQSSGSFTTSFAFSREQRQRIKARSEGDCGIHVDEWFQAVAIVPRPDGEHVVVAMGTQGALHRSPAGAWTRVAVLDREPVSLQGPSWLRDLSLTPLVGAALSPIVLIVGWRRRSKARGLAGLGVALVGSLGLLSLAGGLLFFGLDYVVAGPLIAVLSVVVFLASILIARTREAPTGTDATGVPRQ